MRESGAVRGEWTDIESVPGTLHYNNVLVLVKDQ